MKNYLRVGDKVCVLVNKIEHDHVFGEQICSKGTVGYVCDIGETYVMIEAKNQNGKISVFGFDLNEVEKLC